MGQMGLFEIMADIDLDKREEIFCIIIKLNQMINCSCPTQQDYLAINLGENKLTLSLYRSTQPTPLQIPLPSDNNSHNHRLLIYKGQTFLTSKRELKEYSQMQSMINQNNQQIKNISNNLNQVQQISPTEFLSFLEKAKNNEEELGNWQAQKLLIILITIDVFMVVGSIITLVLQTVYTAHNWHFIMDANRNRAWTFMVFYLAFYMIIPISAWMQQCDRPRRKPINHKILSIEFITHMLAFFVNGVCLFHTLRLARKKHLHPIRQFPQLPFMEKPHCPIFFFYGLKNLLFLACFLTFIVEERFNYTASSGATSDTLVFAFSMAEMALWGLADLKYELNERVADLLNIDLYQEQSQPLKDVIAQVQGRRNQPS